MKIKEAIHLPELALSGGGFGRFGGTKRMWVYVHKWEMANHQTKLVHKVMSHLLGRPMSLLTPRTLVIAVIDHCNRGVRRSPHVVAFLDLHSQPDCLYFTHLNPVHQNPRVTDA